MLEEPDILFNDIWSKMKEEEMAEHLKIGYLKMIN